MSDGVIRNRLMRIYRALYRTYGPQHWWPGDTPFETMVGAILTQNTSWINVEKAIANLKRERLLMPARLYSVPSRRLAALIRPSGYFNIKTKRLKHLLGFVRDHYAGDLNKMFSDNPAALRRCLLSVNGVGPETADSILLYAAGMPFFVVDSYTKRIFSRHGFITPDEDYQQVQKLFMCHLPSDTDLYNEYHALIVQVGKEHCGKRKPSCDVCPLKYDLP